MGYVVCMFDGSFLCLFGICGFVLASLSYLCFGIWARPVGRACLRWFLRVMCCGFLLWFCGEFLGMGGVMVWFVVLGVVCSVFVCVLIIVCVLYGLRFLCEFLVFGGRLLVMFVFSLCLFVRCMIIVDEVLCFVIFLVFGLF